MKTDILDQIPEVRSNLSQSELDLFTAVQEEEVLDIIDLIKAGVNANCRDEWQFTPLMRAAIEGKAMSICALRDAKAIFNATNINGETALMMAAKLDRKNTDTISALIDGSGSDFLTKIAPQILQIAVIAGNVSTIEHLLNRGTEVDSVGNDGIAPIFHAIKSRDFATKKILLNRGASIDVRDKDGLTPILFAIKNNDLIAIKTLLTVQDSRNKNTEYDSKEFRNERDYELLIFALNHNPKAIEELLIYGISLFSTATTSIHPDSHTIISEKKEAAIDVMINNSIATSHEDKDVAIERTSMIIQKSLLEVSRYGNFQMKKWQNHLLPHLLNENVQELLNSDAIDSLKSSFLNKKVLEVIVDNFNKRNPSQSLSQDSSTDTYSQENNDLNSKNSTKESLSDHAIEENIDDMFIPERRSRSGGFDDTKIVKLPAASPSLVIQDESKSSGSQLKRTTSIGKNFNK